MRRWAELEERKKFGKKERGNKRKRKRETKRERDG